MILGFVLIGTVAGMIAGLTMLITGTSVLAAFMIYAGVGVMTILATVGAVILADSVQRSQIEPHKMQPMTKRPDTPAPLNEPPRKSPAV
ncbi:hypothetical protein ACXYMO_06750 [Arenibacterium sp. CAU 1754]